MLDRMSLGELPRKHHLVFRGRDGQLRFEHCITREGFDGPYTISYHEHEPHTPRLEKTPYGFALPEAAPPETLARRHYLTGQVEAARRQGAPLQTRIPLLFNSDVVIGVLFPTEPDPCYFVNGDGDDLYYIHEGGGLLRTVLGDIHFAAQDYVFVPKGILHRFIPTPGVKQHWLSFECLGGLHFPKQFRNEVGQLRMDAPYCHRDFKRPTFMGCLDEEVRHIVVKRQVGGAAFHGYEALHSPLDVVGWDGTVYPWAFPILNFQPRAGLVHLPPTLHGTFAMRGGLVCSFVPRMVDFHPEAIPCPYPHSSVDCDEFIFYCHGNFTSRRGVGPGSVSFHPAGVPHGPHPGAYERSIGHQRTDELAVMLDTFKPLIPTSFAAALEQPDYHHTFIP